MFRGEAGPTKQIIQEPLCSSKLSRRNGARADLSTTASWIGGTNLEVGEESAHAVRPPHCDPTLAKPPAPTGAAAIERRVELCIGEWDRHREKPPILVQRWRNTALPANIAEQTIEEGPEPGDVGSTKVKHLKPAVDVKKERISRWG